MNRPPAPRVGLGDCLCVPPTDLLRGRLHERVASDRSHAAHDRFRRLDTGDPHDRHGRDQDDSREHAEEARE